MNHREIPDLSDADLDRLVRSLHVDLADPEACWTQHRKDGTVIEYPPRFGLAGQNLLTSRVVYRVVLGADPVHATVEHTCGRGKQGCVNPHHMILLSLRDNVMADTSHCAGALNARKTHCLNGHPFDSVNTRVGTDAKGRTHRTCRACERARDRARTR